MEALPYIPVVVILEDEPSAVVNFNLTGRGDALPRGAEWDKNRNGWWMRPDDDGLIIQRVEEVMRGRKVVKMHIIRDGSIPLDRTYRNALTHDGNGVTHDIEKAKEIQRNQIRFDRSIALVELDAQWMKAMGAKDQSAADAIEAQRQVWRDAPADPAIDAAKTVDDLRALPTVAQTMEVLKAVK